MWELIVLFIIQTRIRKCLSQYVWRFCEVGERRERWWSRQCCNTGVLKCDLYVVCFVVLWITLGWFINTDPHSYHKLSREKWVEEWESLWGWFPVCTILMYESVTRHFWNVFQEHWASGGTMFTCLHTCNFCVFIAYCPLGSPSVSLAAAWGSGACGVWREEGCEQYVWHAGYCGDQLPHPAQSQHGGPIEDETNGGGHLTQRLSDIWQAHHVGE